MAHETLEKRVENLEILVAGLADLPERVTALEGQFLQFRGEVARE